jgi:hypothetical protein
VRAKGASRDLKNVFSSKSYTSGSARKRSRPDRGCRRSIERAGRAAGSPFALIDSVSKKIAKIKSESETLFIGPGNQD